MYAISQSVDRISSQQHRKGHVLPDAGRYARMSDEPDFQYLGGGAVTFKLETEDGIIYNYTITISIDGSNVNFKAEDDLPK